MGTGELVLIFLVYLMLFGAKGIPSLAQTMGKAVYQFRNAARDVQKEIIDSTRQIKNEVNISQTLTDNPAAPPVGTEPDRSLKPDQDFG
jgi:sec-independent protein translocase protein TatA